MDQFISQLALTIVGGTIGAGLTMIVGWRQFRKQRWWDKKAEAYIALLDAFHPILDEDAAYIEEMELQKEMPDAAKAALRAAAREGELKIRYQQRLSAVLICEKADKVLQKMFRQLEAATNTTDWTVYRNDYSIALWGGFDALKKCAVEDLRVGK